MSTAEAGELSTGLNRATLELPQKHPQVENEGSPNGHRDHKTEQQTAPASVFLVTALTSIVALVQVAWLAFLVYYAHRLLT